MVRIFLFATVFFSALTFAESAPANPTCITVQVLGDGVNYFTVTCPPTTITHYRYPGADSSSKSYSNFQPPQPTNSTAAPMRSSDIPSAPLLHGLGAGGSDSHAPSDYARAASQMASDASKRSQDDFFSRLNSSANLRGQELVAGAMSCKRAANQSI